MEFVWRTNTAFARLRSALLRSQYRQPHNMDSLLMKTTVHTRIASVLALFSIVAVCQSAVAQTAPENKEQASTVVGFGAGYVPEYDGAQKRRAIPVLFGEYRNGEGFFVSSMRGIGMEQ